MMLGISGLAENPHMAPLVIELASNMRRLVSGAHVVFYRVGDKVVEVVRVLHQRMDAADRLEGA